MRYTVRAGDSLYLIAQRFGVTVRDLLAANPQIQDPSRLTLGQTLWIPTSDQPPNTAEHLVRPGETFFEIARSYGISVAALAAANPQVRNPELIRPGQILYIPRRPMQRYVVQPGDTLFRIALAYGLTVEQLRRANPGIAPETLQPGQRINLPADAQEDDRDIVIPRDNYGFEAMTDDLARLASRYPFLERSKIGQSVMGRDLHAIRVGRGRREVHFNASFHAHEWITTPLLMRFLEVYAQAYQRRQRVGDFHIPTLYEQTSLWIVPMVNPDGVELVQRGISEENPYFETVLRANDGSRDFRPWAANIRGVDLNNQFPADWEREAERGERAPAPRGYPGPSPLSEPESRAMAEFTRAHDFRMVLAYHSQGKVIFWGYKGLEPPESRRIVSIFAEASGYEPIRYVESWAGYKDWFIQEWRRPGFTVEVGRGVNPLPFGQFWEIWSANIGILLSALAL